MISMGSGRNFDIHFFNYQHTPMENEKGNNAESLNQSEHFERLGLIQKRDSVEFFYPDEHDRLVKLCDQLPDEWKQLTTEQTQTFFYKPNSLESIRFRYILNPHVTPERYQIDVRLYLEFENRDYMYDLTAIMHDFRVVETGLVSSAWSDVTERVSRISTSNLLHTISSWPDEVVSRIKVPKK